MNYGLNYMGSKNTIAQELVQYMLARHPNKGIFVDATMGGGAMTHYILRETESINVIANDLNPYFTDLYRMMLTYPDMVKEFAYSWCNREYVMGVLKDPKVETSLWKVAVVNTIWSFGGGGESYLYGEDIQDLKFNLYNAVINNLWSDDLLPFKQTLPPTLLTNNGIDFINKRLEIVRLYGKYRGEQFHLENLNRAERLAVMCDDFYKNRHRIKIFTRDYSAFIQNLSISHLSYAVIYIDPPYENTAEYVVNHIDYVQFWNFVESFKDKAPIYVSSYEAPERITKVWESGKVVGMAGAKHRKVKMEKLYYNNFNDVQDSLFDLLT